MSKLQSHQLLALGLAFLSFFMSALVSQNVFERLPHLEDELAYVYQARIFAHGDVVIKIPEPRRAFWQPFVVDNRESGNRFGKYTPGWPLLLSLGVSAGQMWVINAFFAALNVALTYRLGAEIFSKRVGLLAAALLAFSPMALLLNGTLMSHTSSLFFATLFIYGYWRIERGQHGLCWGLVAGSGLGILIISRPSTAIAIAFPFILWSIVRLIRDGFIHDDESSISARLWITIKPFLALAFAALLISAILPWFNYEAVGDPAHNLYREVWDYDRLGFGDCCGRHGHTITKGVRHARFDLSLTAADLFGWQIDLRDGITRPKQVNIDATLQEHLRTKGDYWPLTGLSLFLLPIGLLRGFRKRWMWLWLIIALAWFIIPLAKNMDFVRGFVQGDFGSRTETETPLWIWLGIGTAWLLAPILPLSLREQSEHQTHWTWLLLWTFISVVMIYMAYWVGSQRYSTRYYFEALSALAIIGALAFDWLIHQLATRSRHTRLPGSAGHVAGYGLFAAALLWSLYTYSTPRISALHQFNRVTQDVIDSIQARRNPYEKTLVLVSGQSGTVTWRSFGSLMAVTDPYFENDIIVAWQYDPDNLSVRSDILERFPDRQIIEMAVLNESAWFIDGDCEPGEEASVSPDCMTDASSDDT